MSEHQPVQGCPLCGTERPRRVLDGREDHEYGIQVQLNYWQCSGCRLVFAAPMPEPATLATFYDQYTTHAAGANTRSRLGRWLRTALRNARTRELRAVMNALARPARCLDYGCGAGEALELLDALGAAKVVGYEPDPRAREVAQQRGVAVHGNERDALEAGPYDLVLLDHVIEHLIDPVATLRRMAAAMAPGGLLLIRTPNAQSRLAARYGAKWRGWETPRHLWIFCETAIRALDKPLLAAGLSLERLSSSNRMFMGFSLGSLPRVASRPLSLARQAWVLLVWPIAELNRRIDELRGRLSGEELVAYWRVV